MGDQWVLLGGYCAANLALRHPGLFGASGIMDGYYRPQDGPAAAALPNNAASEAANNPLRIAAVLARGVSPLPASWIAAGTGAPVDILGATEFAKALHGVEQVPLYREPNAGHNFYAWAPAVPRMLSWMWQQLAPPDLRVRFPIAGGIQTSTLDAPGSAVAGRGSRGGRLEREHSAVLAHGRAARAAPVMGASPTANR